MFNLWIEFEAAESASFSQILSGDDEKVELWVG
jgi:hypothetical protein